MSNFTAWMRNFSWNRYVTATQREAGQRNPGRSRAQRLDAGSSLNLSPGEQGTAGSVGAAGKVGANFRLSSRLSPRCCADVT